MNVLMWEIEAAMAKANIIAFVHQESEYRCLIDGVSNYPAFKAASAALKAEGVVHYLLAETPDPRPAKSGKVILAYYPIPGQPLATDFGMDRPREDLAMPDLKKDEQQKMAASENIQAEQDRQAAATAAAVEKKPIA